ncbi:MAG: hypothetical protein P1V35_05345 [Planctomycetota bacterium]|nr:hypothetical protein [Planctomycetota bacterium]
MNLFSKPLFLLPLLAVSCSDSSDPAVEEQNNEELTKKAMVGDKDAMQELEKKVVEASKQVKTDIEENASKGDEKALVVAAWMNGG